MYAWTDQRGQFDKANCEILRFRQLFFFGCESVISDKNAMSKEDNEGQ